ncbi:MAG: aminoacyl-tRNA hydrolase [Coriobacteriaceae bacterium]|jgi:PTH1 family peptidyl-tRNA hydrolase|nr:aminoacyl-tRNA hydrolase [Coriobacteriaceae bacterium]
MAQFLKSLIPTIRSSASQGDSKRASDSQRETYLVVGLGNPGDAYAHTRHNAGFDTLDLIAEELQVRYWKSECGAATTKATYQDVDVVLAKPQSFMNVSGGSVKQLLKTYRIDLDHLVVIHDDLDIESGTIRVKWGGGHAGHNGLRSLGDKLTSRDWYRVRIGIGKPPGRMDTADYVLQAPKKEALDDFVYACNRGSVATLFLIKNGLEKTQQEFN